MNRFEMRERLENKLTKKRFEHSLGVEYEAAWPWFTEQM